MTVAIIFIAVFSLLAYSVVKFRGRHDDDRSEPPQIYGNNQVELAWTVIPVPIVVASALMCEIIIKNHRSPSPKKTQAPALDGPRACSMALWVTMPDAVTVRKT
jgi:heme/copper-type cytochrome/quinol oxidase subunit 2